MSQFGTRLRTHYLCPLIVAALSLLATTPASSQTTALYLDSEPGDFVGGGIERTIVPGQATFTATVPFSNVVEVRVTDQAGPVSWFLRFSAAGAVPLQVGTYNNATSLGIGTQVGMSVSGESRGCNAEGRFHVREIAFAGTSIQRLAIDFEQHCSAKIPALIGAIRYNSTVSSLVPFDGAYPIYRIELELTSHGRVTGFGVDCYGNGPICALDFVTPASIAVTAIPDPGYMFAGWGGPCKGGLTSVPVLVNTVRQCRAVFVPAAGADVSAALLTGQKGNFVANGARHAFNPTNSRWRVVPTTASGTLNSLYVALDQIDDGSVPIWEFVIAAPTGMPLEPGSYANVPKDRTTTSHGFRTGSGCFSSTSDLVLHELVITAGVVTRLAFDFSTECLPVANPLRPFQGSIRFNSQVPLRPSLAVTTTTGGGTVAFAGGAACGVQCVLPAEPELQVGLAATPTPGFFLARWAGDADCEDGSVTISGPLACEAVFERLLAANLVTPATGTGISQTFTLDYSSALGGHDVATAWAWFPVGGLFSSVNSCLMYYEQATGLFFLLDDAAKTWASAAAGSNGTLRNSRCSIGLATSGATVDGETLRVTVDVTFTALAAGDRSIMMYAANSAGYNSEWQMRGNWTVPPSIVTAVAASPNAGSGTRQTFALTYGDTFGGANLTQAWVWFTQAFGGSSANSCLAYFDRPTGRLALLNDAGTAWSFAAIGSAQALQNSQCALAPTASSASSDGTLLTVNLTVTFKAAYAGTKQIWMYATNGGRTSNWQNRGTWTAQASLLTSGVPAPASGTGATQSFVLPYSGNLGATSISTAWVWFNAALATSAANSCLVYYEQSANTLFLLNDAATQWHSAVVGAATTLQNGQCSIAVAGSTATTSGEVLTLQLAMTFKPSFAGPKNIFMYTDGIGDVSGWLDRGDWVVPSPPPPVTADVVTPGAGSSASQAFSLSYSSTSGAADLTSTWVWFNSTLAQSAAASCLIYYEPATTLVYLLNDAGTTWQSAALGSGSTALQNSQCVVNLTDSQVGLNGNTLTLTLRMTFKPAFAGGKNVYLYAIGSGGNSGWQDRGDWTVPGSATADSATPGSGTGSSQIFELQYSSVNGASALTTTWVWFNETLAPSAAESCLAYYDQATNMLFLLNDAGTAWQSATIGGAGTLQNSRCSIDTSAASVASAGNTLTLGLPVTFAALFTGPKNIYLYAADAQSTSGWQDRGDWTAP